MCVVDVVAFDGAGQTEQLDQPAMVHHQGVDVPTGQDLGAETRRYRVFYLIQLRKIKQTDRLTDRMFFMVITKML